MVNPSYRSDESSNDLKISTTNLSTKSDIYITKYSSYEDADKLLNNETFSTYVSNRTLTRATQKAKQQIISSDIAHQLKCFKN